MRPDIGRTGRCAQFGALTPRASSGRSCWADHARPCGQILRAPSVAIPDTARFAASADMAKAWWPLGLIPLMAQSSGPRKGQPPGGRLRPALSLRRSAPSGAVPSPPGGATGGHEVAHARASAPAGSRSPASGYHTKDRHPHGHKFPGPAPQDSRMAADHAPVHP